MNQEQSQQEKKKPELVNPKTIAIAIAVLLVGLVIYGIINNDQEEQSNQDDEEKSNGLPVWFWIVLGLGAAFWLASKALEHDWSKPKRVKVDEFVNQIHIPRLIRQGFINGIYRPGLKYPVPQSCDVTIGDARPLSETGTGSRTWIAEIEFYNDKPTRWDGVHTVMVNLDNTKEDLEQGDYALFWGIDWVRFVRDKSYRRKLPFVTPEDEQMKMLQLLGDSGQYDKEEINQMMMNRYNVKSMTPQQNQMDYGYGDDPNRLYNNDEGDTPEPAPQQYGNYAPAVSNRPYKKKRKWF